MEPRVLTGFTVGITADRRWEEQAALFERRGATVVHAPTIKTLPLGDELSLRRATEDVIGHPPAAFIANTGLGVRSWLTTADTWGTGPALVAALARTRIYARGPKASGAVHAAGLEVFVKGRSERLRDLTDEVIERLEPGDTVAVQVDGSSTSPELDRLRRAGARVVAVPVYRWTRPHDEGPALRLAEAVLAGRVHAVTFTAGPAAHNWMAACAENGVADDLRRALTDGQVTVGCVGPVCTEAAAAEGLLSPYLVSPDAYRIGPLVRAVAEALVKRRITIAAGPRQMVLSGNTVLLDDHPLPLTDTEARLLRALAARPNAVVTKEALLRDVWGSAPSGTHAVEVAVARLRKRLGDHGRAVRSVHRRGYMLVTTAAPSPRRS